MDSDRLASKKPADLDLHYFQNEIIPLFSIEEVIKVRWKVITVKTMGNVQNMRLCILNRFHIFHRPLTLSV